MILDIFLSLFYLYILKGIYLNYVGTCLSVSAGAYVVQNTASALLELELQVVVICLNQLLGTGLRTSGRTANMFTCWAISPVSQNKTLHCIRKCQLPNAIHCVAASLGYSLVHFHLAISLHKDFMSDISLFCLPFSLLLSFLLLPTHSFCLELFHTQNYKDNVNTNCIAHVHKNEHSVLNNKLGSIPLLVLLNQLCQQTDFIPRSRSVWA